MGYKARGQEWGYVPPDDKTRLALLCYRLSFESAEIQFAILSEHSSETLQFAKTLLANFAHIVNTKSLADTIEAIQANRSRPKRSVKVRRLVRTQTS